ncbi:MAG: endonuclease III [Candidatus Eisenbacteria bacterium]|nr:endonuclease III [Candidatus Eisenbacteria bacterium]
MAAKNTAGDKNELRGPLGEDYKTLRSRALKIHRRLKKAYPDAHIPLRFSSPLELLIATILSAQCTDAKVNEVTEDLFRKYGSAKDWAKAPLRTLEKEVRPTGFYRNKARAIKESTEDIVERFDGRVPETLEELTSLRGVGRKSANVIIAHAFGGAGIIVDTHFIRLSRRMGLTAELDPVKIERDLMHLLPRKHWSDFSLMMTWHGRATCTARKPSCNGCAVSGECPARDSRGEVKWDVKLPPRKKGRSGK